MGHGVEVVRGRQFSSYSVVNAELKEKLSQLETAQDKIVNLTDAYEEQSKTLKEQSKTLEETLMKLDDQKKETEACKEQNKTYSQQIDSLQCQMAKMQEFLQKFLGFHPSAFSGKPPLTAAAEAALYFLAAAERDSLSLVVSSLVFLKLTPAASESGGVCCIYYNIMMHEIELKPETQLYIFPCKLWRSMSAVFLRRYVEEEAFLDPSVIKFWDTRHLKAPVTHACPHSESSTEEKRLHGISSLSQDLNGVFITVSCMDHSSQVTGMQTLLALLIVIFTLVNDHGSKRQIKRKEHESLRKKLFKNAMGENHIRSLLDINVTFGS
ncbi:hypothetical protein BUALT_Bualt19G0076500 [Buddleja alternifolia]|uniref:Uncharacterized protein n=1 Tax=Buddleja alternifolia TaxID=168488 RepID=A0AAV6W1S6_9LAMI|nr:hypothetical protein BUALT_Bualt19G0076500 [Buddleja alternifolia]